MPEPIRIQSIHHVAVVTDNVPASTAFYRDVLGFDVIPRPGFSFDGSWLFDPTSGLQIHVIDHSRGAEIAGVIPAREIDGRTNHFALSVPDLDKAEELLKEHHVDYLRQINAGGYQQIFFRDPAGNHIELGIYPETVTE